MSIKKEKAVILISDDENKYLKVQLSDKAYIPEDILGDCTYFFAKPYGTTGYHVSWTKDSYGTKSVFFPNDILIWFSFDGLPGEYFEVSGNVTVIDLGK